MKKGGWRARGIVRVDLNDLGLNGCWVDVLRPDFLTLAELEEIGVTPETAADQALPRAETLKLLALCIQDWNVPHPNKDEILPLPRENPKMIEDMLPAGFIRTIVDKLRDVGALRGELPFPAPTQS